MQRLGGVGNSAAPMNHQEGVEGVAVHGRSMQKADATEKNNKFVG
jgi:hypothetical protein